ncbi:MAG: hypothetical protein V2A73_07645, partial [Pseudomonadota bacterium]
SYLLPVTLGLGCGQSLEDETQVVSEALEGDFGEMSEENEEQNFDDPAMVDEEIEGGDTDAADDTLDTDPTANAAENDTANVHRARVLLLWGRLHPQPKATDVTDWSGKISVANGAVRVLRLVRFEKGDHIVRPRSDIRTLDFASATAPGRDGLLLEVVAHPSLNTDGGKVKLTFDTVPIKYELVLEQGMKPVDLVKVDEVGNAFAYMILPPRPVEICEAGYILGHWLRAGTADGRTVGHIRARYLDDEGQLLGKIRGIYGERKNHSQVFFAKAISTEGEFQAVLAGRYRLGRFGGLIINRSRVIDGLVYGFYGEGARIDDDKGFIIGRWARKCGESIDEGNTIPSDENLPEVDGENEAATEGAAE